MTTRDYTANVISATKVVPDGNFKDSKASGVWDINEALDLIKGGNWPNAANFNPSAFVDNLFQTHIYEGNGSTGQTITNGIDLSGEGGLVWTKSRETTSGDSHYLFDTERGVSAALFTNLTNAESTASGEGVVAFNSNGFDVDGTSRSNTSGIDYVSWTFRKQPKFFDIQTFSTTYNTTPHTLTVDLEGTLGMAIFKSTDATGQANNWIVWHREFSDKQYIRLNDTSGVITDSSYGPSFNSSTKEFTFRYPMSTAADRLISGSQETTNWVGYFFAHNNNDGGFGEPEDQDIIKCGSYTGNGSGQDINLGFEAQWVMIKPTSTTGNWTIMDVMRNMPTSGIEGRRLQANTSSAEGTANYLYGMKALETGFTIDGLTANDYNKNGETYIYMAIRRGGMQTPTAATDVFDVDAITTVPTTGNTYTSSFDAPDLLISRRRDGTQNWQFTPRLTSRILMSSSTAAEQTTEYNSYKDLQDGVDWIANWSNDAGNYIQYFWKRARGFFDVVCYNGTGSAQNITHNLGVTPEFYIVKRRDSTGGWYAYHKSIDKDGDGLPETDAIQFNGNAAAFDSASYWNDTAPTATTFTVGTTSGVNASGGTYIAYLFASLDGIAKVGGYTGNGSSSGPTVNLGFAPRFVFITKWGGTAGGGNKYVFDTERGIVAGNDPYLDFRNSNTEDSSSDLIDPDSNGFTISSSNGNINANGGEYMFYAIA